MEVPGGFGSGCDRRWVRPSRWGMTKVGDGEWWCRRGLGSSWESKVAVGQWVWRILEWSVGRGERDVGGGHRCQLSQGMQ